MKITKNMLVEVFSETVVVGQNPEFADVGNPLGDIIDTVYYVAISDIGSGVRIRHGWNFPNKEGAQTLADRVEARGTFLPQCWSDHRPIYGSKAYEDNIEEEILLENKC